MEEMRRGIYIGRENMVVFVCGLVWSAFGRLANSCDSNLETINEGIGKWKRNSE